MEGGESPEYITCPGQCYTIPIAMCEARQKWGFPGCLKCKYRIRKKKEREKAPDEASQPTLFDLS